MFRPSRTSKLLFLVGGYRVVHACAPEPDGAVTHIRHVFDVIDADTWRDRTYTRVGDDGAWTLVYEDVFPRVE